MNMLLGVLLFLLQSGPRPVILTIGDSITAGYGVNPSLSYPAQLEQELSRRGYTYRVMNQSAPGRTTAQAAGLLTQALALQPAIVIIQVGGNDRGQGIPKDASIRNVRLMIERFKPGGARIFFAGGRVSYLDEAARQEGVEIIPLLEGVAGHPELLLSDGVHPTAEGHAIIVQNVLRALAPLLPNAPKGELK